MLSSEGYRQLSDRCAQIAIASSAPSVAQTLMALAFDYLTRADKADSLVVRHQRQQRVYQEPIDGFGD
jgi:hypothetical protein